MPIPIHKHIARFIAILSLYSDSMLEQSQLNDTVKSIKQAYLNKDIFDLGISAEKLAEIELHIPDEQLLTNLIDLIIKNKAEIEKVINNNLIEKYTLNKLDKVIRAILCLATAELLYAEDVPAKIIIDEYVSLTKTFYENNEAGFVNKVLDVIARSIRAAEISS